MPTKRELEDIDRIVDNVIEDEKTAKKLKRALHDSVEDTSKPADAGDDENGEDLWDDVPV